MNWRRGFFRLWIVLSLLWVAGASHYYQLIEHGCGPIKGGEQYGWYCNSGWYPVDDNVGYEIVPFDEALAWTIGPPVGVLLLGFLMFRISRGIRRASN